MKVTKENDEIVIRIPFWSKRHNPYMEGEDVGSHTTLVGLLTKDQWGNDECGFAYNIDMSYKGGGDQYTGIMIQYDGGDEEFKKICTDLKIGYIDDRLADPDTDYEND